MLILRLIPFSHSLTVDIELLPNIENIVNFNMDLLHFC